MNIDTNIIMEALSYYTSLGYKPIKAPYLVLPKYSEATSPDGKKDLQHIDGSVYVASAEQSFLQMMCEGSLKKGKYMALTPCYRDEELLDESHFNIFLKLELFSTNTEDFPSIVRNAKDFYNTQGVETYIDSLEPYQHDLISVLSGVELGSYGVRSVLGVEYSYGTGLAEPRFSKETTYELDSKQP